MHGAPDPARQLSDHIFMYRAQKAPASCAQWGLLTPCPLHAILTHCN